MSEKLSSLDERLYDFDVHDQLEAVDYNDYLVTMYAQADAAENECTLQQTTSERRREIERELDGKWRYMKQPILMSGRVLTKLTQLTSDIVEYETDILEEDEWLISTGFVILPFSTVCGDEVMTSYKTALSFTRDGKTCAMLREDFSGTFVDDSPDMIERRLLYYQPSETRRINQLLKRSETPSILDFREYTAAVIEPNESGRDVARDIEAHLFEVLEFDHEVPYQVTYGTDKKWVTVVASVDKIELLHLREGKFHRFRPFVHLCIYGATPKQPNVHVRVPFSDLRGFTSLRSTRQYTSID